MKSFVLQYYSYTFSILGTQRDPSAFEYPSTAPAILSTTVTISREPQESTAVLVLLSTTRLGLQRSEGTVDTYIPGTLPERLYKRAQLQVQVDDDDINGCYRLTTQDTPITANEIETMLVVEEDGKEIDRAIETIKKTVRSSVRSRVATSRAVESHEQGTLGIASLFDS